MKLADELQDIVGISILRSGGPFSHGLRRVIRDVPIGAMLIQSDPRTGEPLLLNLTLPERIKNQEQSAKTQVFLLDSQMGTGAAACELMEHSEVKETSLLLAIFLWSQQMSFGRGCCR